ncbi:MAG: hypothetical protein EB127_06465 [Alphaproteobacteria bacterium]|nr:hypothetical protein [Alphaproteobacteria bacterium]
MANNQTTFGYSHRVESCPCCTCYKARTEAGIQTVCKKEETKIETNIYYYSHRIESCPCCICYNARRNAGIQSEDEKNKNMIASTEQTKK